MERNQEAGNLNVDLNAPNDNNDENDEESNDNSNETEDTLNKAFRYIERANQLIIQ